MSGNLVVMGVSLLTWAATFFYLLRLERRIKVGVVLGQVLAEVRMLTRPHRTAILAQVKRVERVTFGGKALGDVRRRPR